MEGVLTDLTSRSPTMMSEMMKLFLLTDEHDIIIMTKYIRNAANVWADRPSRETDNADWQMPPPPHLPLLRQAMGAPHHRPLRLLRKQEAPALQCQVERREGRGGGLHPPSGSRMAPRKQLVQPSVVPPRRLHRTTKTISCGGHRHRPQMASLPLIHPSLRDGLRSVRNAALQESLLSAAARGARGG